MTTAKFSPTTGGIYPCNVYTEFPPDAVDIPDELYQEFKNGEIAGFDISNGQVIELVTTSNINSAYQQSEFIDNFVISKISAPEFDYPSVAECRSWIDHQLFGIEARQCLEWALECQTIGFKIKNGLLVFDSVDDAIAALPSFDVTPVNLEKLL